MENNKLKKYYNSLIEYDIDYGELFYEDSQNKIYKYIDNRLDDITINNFNGIGITMYKDKKKFYGSTSNLLEVDNIINKLKKNYNVNNSYEYVNLKVNDCVDKNKENILLSEDDKKNLFNEINDYARNFSDLVNQVDIKLIESIRNVKVVNQNGINMETRYITRLIVTVFAKENDKSSSSSISPGFSTDNSFLKEFNWKKLLDEALNDLLEKLNTVPFKGGEIPVILGPGFGAVIFHEACGHAMESYGIIDGTSVLTNKINKKIASDKVTIIDDGTIDNLYGTTNFDDEGVKTQKNVLIENGILKNYLTNITDSKIIGNEVTGSARRELYIYPSISRMNNTYLEKGNDKIDDMIKSIKYGLFAKNMGGGSVSPNTGEFNFNVSFGYIIEDGKLTKPIKNVSLIGNTLDILNNVEMVSDDLEFGTGYCGSLSGSVPVTIGQPTIKVSKILVGGNNE